MILRAVGSGAQPGPPKNFKDTTSSFPPANAKDSSSLSARSICTSNICFVEPAAKSPPDQEEKELGLRDRTDRTTQNAPYAVCAALCQFPRDLPELRFGRRVF